MTTYHNVLRIPTRRLAGIKSVIFDQVLLYYLPIRQDYQQNIPERFNIPMFWIVGSDVPEIAVQ